MEGSWTAREENWWRQRSGESSPRPWSQMKAEVGVGGEEEEGEEEGGEEERGD